MRLALSLVTLLLAGSAQAQDLRIVDPVLSVDGRRAATVGAPLVQRTFGVLTMRAPGVGTFTVGARPFAGARVAGQFDGDGLYFAGGGRSVRLRSAGPILGDGTTRPAYVRFQAARSARDRGPVRLSIADAPDGRGDRNAAPMPVVAERVLGPRRGPAPPRPARVSLEATRLRAETARLRADLDRLIAERQALADQRARLVTERDAALAAQSATDTRLQRALRERDAAASRSQAALTDRERRLDRTAQNAAELTRRLTQQRDALATERDRLLAERNTLIAARAAAEAARERDAAAFRDAQSRLDARPAAPASGELRTLRAQLDELRARLVARDATIEALRAERDDRTGQAAGVTASMAEVQVRLADARRELVTARTERDAALAEARAARAELDAARRARTASQAELATLRAERDAAVAARDAATGERDRLRTQLAARPDTPGEPADVAALRTRLATEAEALAATRAELDRAQRLLRAERAALSAIPRPDGAPAPDEAARLAELDARAAELDRREALLSEQQALQDDRTRLAAELAEARAEIAELRTRLGADRPPRPTAPAADATPRPDGAVAYLPGFDFGRLANPDNVRRRLDEVRYPRWAETGRIEGDVLVLFQTDREGTVIRTAVPTPLGGGLDALAEDLVRQMRFTPPTVSGQPAGLRSQVVVRFEL